MQIFRSKIDLWLIIVMIASILLCIVLALGKPTAMMIAGSTAIFLAALFGWLGWATRYVVETNALTIHTGFYKIRIPLETIKSATPSRNLLASPALSLDRLMIKYGPNKSVLVSPKDKSGFLAAIGQT